MHIAITEKRFAGQAHAVLRGLQCRLTPGEIVAIIGPSGCGKSTLLRIAAGLDTDYTGSIQLDHAEPPGVMFQSPRLMPWLTSLQNIDLVLDGDQHKARQWLTRVGLSDPDALPRTLSGGMQRRVALARAFAREAKLLLLDEPFVSLDQPSADALRALLTELWEQYRPTVVMVTHDLIEALLLADRIIFLCPSPAAVIHDYPVELSRPRERADAQLLDAHAGLLKQYPRLLQGNIAKSSQL
ncbi:MAG: ATP-binding cassette domain-containing protein [Gammaproteobacteria bacterium]|nr:ATP-binding cassette domain-containing protein [Gammaproteobacteria bacterium]